MLKNSNFMKSLRIILLAAIMLPLMYSQSMSQYCSASTTYQDEFIAEFYFNTIAVDDWKWSSTISDYTHLSTDLKMGDTYTAKVVNGYAYSSDQVRLWIDFNQDDKFDTSTEEFILSSSDAGKNFAGDITIPLDAKAGSTRLRVRMTWASTPMPCDGSSYGEVEDYTVNLVPPIPDGQITAMTSPVKPFLVGEYPVIATLRSNNEVAMTACKIDWWVNNVYQGTYNWTGNMRNGQTQNVNLGNYNFVYPENETVFGPFQMRFTVKDVNNDPPDADPSNDTYQVNISPNLNDCGAIGFFGPPEGFGAGVTPVRARIMNFAPKPLSRVTVYWKIDGQEQTPKTFTGLNIRQNQFQDLDMGTFLFYNKTPLGPFEVEVWTENPNAVQDEDPSNDKYQGGIGPSLAAGTYFAGGANAHFQSPAEAASYMNSSGIFGQGAVIIEIRPGTYNGQVILNNRMANDNQLIFRSSTGKAYDVYLVNSPSTANNFVLQLADVNNVTFRNITIQNNNSNISNAGRLVTADNMNGLKFEDVVFNGVSNAPKTAAYNILTLNNVNNFSVTGSDFNRGSAGIWNETSSSPVFVADNNTFMNFSWYGIYNYIQAPANGNDVAINNNTFKRDMAGNPNGAIFSFNGSSIRNNIIADINGVGSAEDALIKVEHYEGYDEETPYSLSQMHTSYIEGNTITNCSNMNGIKVINANAIVNHNQVVMSQSANFGAALIDFMNASGVAGNNMLMGSNILGLDVENSPMLYVIYNTSSVEFNGNPVARVSGDNASIMRNIFVNKGTGTAITAPSATNIDQNVIYTSGNVLANIGGTNYASMAAIHNLGMMIESNSVLVEFFSPSDPHLKVYNAALLFNTPLFNSDDNWAGWYVEHSDFDGEPRLSYYAGADEIFLSISIERQTEGFVDCVGATDNFLTVSSAIGYNAPMTYQWEHDGTPIPGAVDPILYFENLRHQQAGVYRCLVNGPGKTEPIYSHPVAVYVTRSTDITRQPETHGVFVGTVATLSFDAHVNGKNIESAIANDEVKVQWYKVVDEGNDIKLTDNQWISGTRSNYLTIANFRLPDQGEYYATVEGICGMVTTETAKLTEENLEINIIQQPVANTICATEEVIFNVDATSGGSNQLIYQWYKDGNMLTDNLPKIEGTNSKHLIIYNLNKADEGNYYATVTIQGTTVQVQSDMAALKVNTPPVILLQPQDATIEAGRQLMLDVVAEGNDDQEVLNYKWFHNSRLVQDSDDMYYIVDVTTPDNAGEYLVIISNDCGSVTSETVTVTITTGSTSVVEVFQSGYSLTTATPNPVQSVATINFTVPTESFVKITMTDASGAGRIILAEGNFQTGTHNINFNAQDYNLASGTYFYYLESNGVRLAQKLVVIK
ncbi:MAG: T9SS type A sorting domain-containing protein [Candidatus Kapabacteria bacterium]|nr:T9SS type A sorting domain-containing protein [Ignavibacteriota bacterium]MCW5883956.1 T9SS type A sorting domain-containing protein [Candidatus Kapabacteria bacterium]